MYHLVATTTLSRKNANHHGTGGGRAPTFLLSSANPDDCLAKVRSICGDRSYYIAHDMPVYSNEDWTYWIVEQK